jgi:hypothetical protein
MIGDGQNQLQISAPLPLKEILRMIPLSAQPFSLDSPFKRKSIIHALILRCLSGKMSLFFYNFSRDIFIFTKSKLGNAKTNFFRFIFVMIFGPSFVHHRNLQLTYAYQLIRVLHLDRISCLFANLLSCFPSSKTRAEQQPIKMSHYWLVILVHALIYLCKEFERIYFFIPS